MRARRMKRRSSSPAPHNLIFLYPKGLNSHEPVMADSDPSPPIEPPEQPQMEIHRLKPIHSWRDFLKELGTIVLGITIAISLEQLVESWHWNSEVKIARQ